MLVFTEFGRRIKDNGSGTDHGSGGGAFIIGDRVKGGLYAEYPPLAHDQWLNSEEHAPHHRLPRYLRDGPGAVARPRCNHDRARHLRADQGRSKKRKPERDTPLRFTHHVVLCFMSQHRPVKDRDGCLWPSLASERYCDGSDPLKPTSRILSTVRIWFAFIRESVVSPATPSGARTSNGYSFLAG